MADEVPSGDKAVFAFLELIALAFAFEGVSALLNGKPWTTWGGAGIATIVFFLAGIKWPSVKHRLEVASPTEFAKGAPQRFILLGALLVGSLVLGVVLWWHPFSRFNSQPSERQARIKLTSVELAQPHEGGPPFPFFNVFFESVGKLPAIGTNYTYRIYPSADTLSIREAEALQNSLVNRIGHVNAEVTRYAGDGPEFFSRWVFTSLR